MDASNAASVSGQRVAEANPLLGADKRKTVDPSTKSAKQDSQWTDRVVPRRCIVVEPVMAVYILCVMSMTLANQV